MKVRIEHVLVNGIESKPCSVCKATKPISEFGKCSAARNGSSLMYACKDCHNEKRRNSYAKSPEYRKKQIDSAIDAHRQVKIDAVNYMGGMCHHCGMVHEEGVNTPAFQFHHKDPLQKDFAITSARGKRLKALIPELDKCLLLCANCHAMVHYRQPRIRRKAA